MLNAVVAETTNARKNRWIESRGFRLGREERFLGLDFFVMRCNCSERVMRSASPRDNSLITEPQSSVFITVS